MPGLQQISLSVSVVSTADINAINVKYKKAYIKVPLKDCKTICMHVHIKVSWYAFMNKLS